MGARNLYWCEFNILRRGRLPLYPARICERSLEYLSQQHCCRPQILTIRGWGCVCWYKRQYRCEGGFELPSVGRKNSSNRKCCRGRRTGLDKSSSTTSTWNNGRRHHHFDSRGQCIQHNPKTKHMGQSSRLQGDIGTLSTEPRRSTQSNFVQTSVANSWRLIDADSAATPRLGRSNQNGTSMGRQHYNADFARTHR